MKKKSRVQGFSLIEVMIAMGILAILMFMVYLSLHKTTDVYTANASHAWIIHEGRVALDEIAEEVRQGNRLNLKPTILPGIPVEGTEYPIAPNAPASQISFLKITKPDPATMKQKFNTYYTTYLWQASDDTTFTMADPANAAPVLPAGYGPPYKIPGAGWVDANGNRQKDEGRLVRVDPNPDDAGAYHPVKIMCNYVKGLYTDTDTTPNTPNSLGFQVRETLRTVNGNKQIQLRLTLVLVMTDMKNKVIEQKLETSIFLRNAQ